MRVQNGDNYGICELNSSTNITRTHSVNIQFCPAILLTKVLVLLHKRTTYQPVNLQVSLVPHFLVYLFPFALCFTTKKGQHSLKWIINVFSFDAVFGGSHYLTTVSCARLFSTGDERMNELMIREHKQNDSDRVKPKYLGRNLPQCHSVQQLTANGMVQLMTVRQQDWKWCI